MFDTNFVVNIETLEKHEIDIIETFGDNTVVFTKDKKCFPISILQPFHKSYLLESLDDFLLGREPNHLVENLIEKEIKEIKFINIDVKEMTEYMESILKP